MSAMLMPASPRMVPTRPMTPGRSSLRTTSMLRAGGTSTLWSSTITMRGSPLRPASVPAMACSPPAQGDQVDVVAGGGRGGVAHLDAALGGDLRRVDVGHRVLADPAEQALQHRQGEDAGVVVGQLALVLDLEHRRRALVQRREQAAEPLGQRQERAHRLGRLGRADVHGERHELAGQRQADLLGDRVARLVLGLAGARAEVRGDDDLRQLEQRRLGGRLGGEHVERRTADPARRGSPRPAPPRRRCHRGPR